MAVAFPSSGTLIGSVLETLGGYYQGFILDSLGQVIAKPAAVLIYIIAVLGVLLRFLIRRKLDDLFLFVLLGPALFYFVLTTRTEMQGTVWQFGTNQRNQAQVWSEVRSYMGLPLNGNQAGLPPPQPAKVSWIYHQFNKISSSAIRAITAALTRANSNVDVAFLANAELSAAMRSESISDTGLRQLIHGPFMRDCRDMIGAANDSLDPTKGRDVQQQSAQHFEVTEMQRVNPRESNPAAFSYLATLAAKYPSGTQVALTGTASEMTTWIELNRNEFIRTYSVNSEGLDESRSAQDFPETITCRAVWNFVSLGLYEFAARANLEKLNEGVSMGINPEEMMNDLLLVKARTPRPNATPADIQQDRSNMLHLTNRVAAMYLLRNEMKKMSGAAFLNEYSKKGFQNPSLQRASEGDLAHYERLRTQFLEWKERSGIFAAASTLPYYQGLGLYLLSIIFPFFTLLLVVPGRHSGFFMWFFLWLWLKSWDIGFTIVMLLSENLFQLFSFGRDLTSVAASEGWKVDLATNLEALRALDPSFQLTTYYSIIGACLTSVPVISSYLILGSLKGGASLISRGVESMSSPIVEHAFMFQNVRRVISERMLAAEEELRRGQEYLGNYNSGKLSNTSMQGGTREADLATQLDPATRSGATFQHQSGNEMKEGALRAATESGTAAGTAGSVPYAISLGDQLPGSLSGQRGRELLGNITDPIGGREITRAKARRVIETQRMASYLQMREVDLAKETASAPFDTYNLLDIQRRSAISRIAGAFEVPWTTKEGDWESILDARFAYFRQRIENEIASIDARLTAFPGYDMFMRGPGLRDITAWQAFYDISQENEPLTQDYFSTVVTAPNPGGKIEKQGDHFATLRTGSSKGVLAVNDGLVLYKGTLDGRGQTVILRHRNGTYSIISGLDEFDDSFDEGSFILNGHILGRAEDTFEFAVAAPGINRKYDLLEVSPLLNGEMAPTKRKELPDDLAKIFADFDRKIVEKNFEAIPPAR